MKNRIRNLVLIVSVFIIMVQNANSQSGDILFRKHVISSGWNGLFYGVAIDIIGELNGGAAVGIPVITAGTSAILPLLTNPSKQIDYDALVLGGHGRSIGWAHGFALATLIGGEKAWWGDEENSNNYKLTVGAGALSSIGLGILGTSLARNRDWSEGRAELYRLYGWIMPLTGFCASAAFSEEPRVFGGAVLAFGAGGYLLADYIANRNDYTRGEMRATQVLSVLNMGLGWGIFSDLAKRNDYSDDFNRIDWLLPAAGALGGAMAGHLWVKNTNLTPQQGMLSAYATTGGAIVGLGVALLTESEEITPYYLIPYAGGLTAYTIAIELMRKKNNAQAFIPKTGRNNFQFAIMPQNILLNNKIEESGYMLNGRRVGLQPLFAASFTF